MPIDNPTFMSHKRIYLRCWYWFLVSLASYFIVGTSKWDAMHALILMLPFTLTITVANETLFVFKFTVFESALFISLYFLSALFLPQRPRYLVFRFDGGVWFTVTIRKVYPDWIQKNTDQKKLPIWKLLSQHVEQWIDCNGFLEIL